MKKIDLSVIDQFFSAQVSANESEATLKALRPQVEEAVQALIEERGLPRNSPRRIPTPKASSVASDWLLAAKKKSSKRKKKMFSLSSLFSPPIIPKRTGQDWTGETD